MLHEWIFRLLLGLLSIIFAIGWIYNLIKIGMTCQMFYSSTEGPWVALFIRLPLVLCLAGIIIDLINPAFMAWSFFSLHAVVRWVGFFLGIDGLIFFFWVLFTLGKNFSTTLVIKKDHTLITSGPYQWIRHPMYSAFFFLCLASLFLTANWFVGGMGFLGLIIAVIIRTPKEEQMMLDQFGDKYREYMNRTGKYLPRFIDKKS